VSAAAIARRRRPEQTRLSGGRIAAERDAVQIETAATRRAGRNVRRAFTVDERLLEDVTDAVVVLSGWPNQLTLTQFVDEAFRMQLERWQMQYNRGKPFPRTGARLRRGRRPGT
jgi:hypothetical protein